MKKKGRRRRRRRSTSEAARRAPRGTRLCAAAPPQHDSTGRGQECGSRFQTAARQTLPPDAVTRRFRRRRDPRAAATAAETGAAVRGVTGGSLGLVRPPRRQRDVDCAQGPGIRASEPEGGRRRARRDSDGIAIARSRRGAGRAGATRQATFAAALRAEAPLWRKAGLVGAAGGGAQRDAHWRGCAGRLCTEYV